MAASPIAKAPDSRRGFPAFEVNGVDFLFIMKGLKHHFCSVLLTFNALGRPHLGHMVNYQDLILSRAGPGHIR
jgi:hypothetical protein